MSAVETYQSTLPLVKEVLPDNQTTHLEAFAPVSKEAEPDTEYEIRRR